MLRSQQFDRVSAAPADRSADDVSTVLSREDMAEATGRASGPERLTCRIHRRWVHQCIGSPVHVIPVTGYRWCRNCACPVTVTVDERSGTVTLSCPGCGTPAPTWASRQVVRSCRASLAASRTAADRRPQQTPGGPGRPAARPRPPDSTADRGPQMAASRQSGTGQPMTARLRAILRAVAQGRAELSGSCQPDLYVDGLTCSDQPLVHTMVRAGLIRRLTTSQAMGLSVAALTARGRQALADDTIPTTPTDADTRLAG
ncbi:MAG TPA: hypothetical protein VGJ95_20775 [Pseudonocardiaceae bacterium]|jgi:hypothetical protein